MDKKKWIIGFDTDNEKEQILSLIRSSYEKVEEQLTKLTETTFYEHKIYKRTLLKDKTRAILFYTYENENNTLDILNKKLSSYGLTILKCSTGMNGRSKDMTSIDEFGKERHYDYRLNINTLSGETFKINMYNLYQSKKYALQEIMDKIRKHYKYKLLDKYIYDNNIEIPDGFWKYGKKGNDYVCGASNDVVNEIEKYRRCDLKLIYNGVILTNEMIFNNEVVLKNNDTIDVIFIQWP